MKRMLALALASVIVILIGSVTCVPSRAADYSKVGVKPGDWATYFYATSEILFGWTAKLEIENVSGTVVTLSWTLLMPNGSADYTDLISGDISVGGSGIQNWLIAANLSEGDLVFSGSSRRINETISMIVGGVTRVVNHENQTSDLLSNNIWFDKVTGLMVVSRFHVGNDWINKTLIAASLWSGESTLMVIAVGGAAGIATVVVAVAIILRRRKK